MQGGDVREEQLRDASALQGVRGDEMMETVQDLLRELSSASVEKRAISNRDVLNEAYDCGSAFSRGMRLDLGGPVILLISGTPSVDERGRTIHVGDVRAQAFYREQELNPLPASTGI